jgi:hypothetical protein
MLSLRNLTIPSAKAELQTPGCMLAAPLIQAEARASPLVP